MRIWKAHYKDEKHDLYIDIVNTEGDYKTNPLSFEIDNIRFVGTGLTDFSLENNGVYKQAQEKFKLLKVNYFNSDNYDLMLQRYSLDLYIPISVLKKKDNSLIEGLLHIYFGSVEHDLAKPQSLLLTADGERVYMDDIIVHEFSLNVDGHIFKTDKAESSLYFESYLLKICEMIQAEYSLKCCFTCQFSDYSPYGNDDYGTILCYKRYKQDCLKVNSKDDFFKYLEKLDFDSRQETFLCNEYEPRIYAEGYRGKVSL